GSTVHTQAPEAGGFVPQFRRAIARLGNKPPTNAPRPIEPQKMRSGGLSETNNTIAQPTDHPPIRPPTAPAKVGAAIIAPLAFATIKPAMVPINKKGKE